MYTFITLGFGSSEDMWAEPNMLRWGFQVRIDQQFLIADQRELVLEVGDAIF